MRIYNRKDFLDLPEGTVYIKGMETTFHENIQIKKETIRDDQGKPIDWFYIDLAMFEADDPHEYICNFEAMQHDQASIPMEAVKARDGCFEESDLFLVYEKSDLEVLIKLLGESL